MSVLVVRHSNKACPRGFGGKSAFPGLAACASTYERDDDALLRQIIRVVEGEVDPYRPPGEAEFDLLRRLRGRDTETLVRDFVASDATSLVELMRNLDNLHARQRALGASKIEKGRSVKAMGAPGRQSRKLKKQATKRKGVAEGVYGHDFMYRDKEQYVESRSTSPQAFNRLTNTFEKYNAADWRNITAVDKDGNIVKVSFPLEGLQGEFTRFITTSGSTGPFKIGIGGGTLRFSARTVTEILDGFYQDRIQETEGVAFLKLSGSKKHGYAYLGVALACIGAVAVAKYLGNGNSRNELPIPSVRGDGVPLFDAVLDRILFQFNQMGRDRFINQYQKDPWMWETLQGYVDHFATGDNCANDPHFCALTQSVLTDLSTT